MRRICNHRVLLETYLSRKWPELPTVRPVRTGLVGDAATSTFVISDFVVCILCNIPCTTWCFIKTVSKYFCYNFRLSRARTTVPVESCPEPVLPQRTGTTRDLRAIYSAAAHCSVSHQLTCICSSCVQSSTVHKCIPFSDLLAELNNTIFLTV